MHDDCNGKKNNEISFENTSEGNIDRWADILANAACAVGLFSRSICSTILLPNRFFISFNGFNKRISVESKSETVSFDLIADASCWELFDTIKKSSSI